MRKCVYSICVPQTDKQKEFYLACQKNIRDYAIKTGSDYILRTASIDFKLNEPGGAVMEKFHIAELLNYYDRVLFLDSDVFVREDSPNIFEEYDDEHCYMLDEGKEYNIHYDYEVEKLKEKFKLKWTKNEHYENYNLGVILTGQKDKELFQYNERYFFKERFHEQFYLMYKIHQAGGIKKLNKKYNTEMYFKKDDGYFLHFANVSGRFEQIKKYI